MRLIFLISLATSLGILALVIEFSRRDLLDRNSFFIGLTVSIGLGFFSVMPEILRITASLLNIQYTYVLTSTVGILALLILNVYTLARLVGTQRKLNELAQEVAIES
jgi:hypothetical protein